VRYVVKKNGKVICRTTATSCTYKGVLGPKQRITLTAIGGNGSTATITVGQSSSRFGLLSRVTNFDIFGSKLDWKKRYQLNQIAKAIKAAGFTKIRLIGNTDDIGSSKVDRALSLARAKVVKAYLSSLLKGVTFTIDAAGRTNPIKSNAKVINRKYNRRVDIFAA
jgi:outer membrane protein OmpA-like peptidoglycan-associated protein